MRIEDLPKDLKAELQQILEDPEKFIKLLHIPDKESSKRVRFAPNLEQLRLLKRLIGRRRVIVLKPRQIGVSTLIRAYALWQVY